MSISIGKDECLRAFGRRFVVEAKSLSKLCSLTPQYLASALAYAIKPFPHLNIFRSKLIGPIDSETVLFLQKLNQHTNPLVKLTTESKQSLQC